MVEAAREVTVSGPGGSFVTLDVPRQVIVDFRVRDDAFFDYVVLGQWRTTGFHDVEIDGSGPWHGVVLAADGPAPPPGHLCGRLPDEACPPVAMALQLEDSVVSMHRWHHMNLGFRNVESNPSGSMHVPEGRYRLYLVGDDSEQRATVRFHGLDGAISVIADGMAPSFENRRLEPRLDFDTGQRAVQSFGVPFEVDEERHVVTVNGLAVSGATMAGTEWGYCFYFDDHPDNDEVAYLPTCPSRWTTEGRKLDVSGGDRGTRQTVMWAAGGRGSGREAAGIWYATYGVGERAEAPFLLLDVSATP